MLAALDSRRIANERGKHVSDMMLFDFENIISSELTDAIQQESRGRTKVIDNSCHHSSPEHYCCRRLQFDHQSGRHNTLPYRRSRGNHSLPLECSQMWTKVESRLCMSSEIETKMMDKEV